MTWLEPTPWDIAQQEAKAQDSFAAIVASAIKNGGVPDVER